MSCILVFYLLLGGVIASPGASAPRATCTRRHLAEWLQTPGSGDPDALYASERTSPGPAPQRRSGPTGSQKSPTRFRGGLEARARALLAGRASAGSRTQGPPRGRHRGRTSGRRHRAQSARRSFLDRGQHGSARRVVRTAAGPQVPRRHQGRAADRAASSIPPSSRARPTARSDAGISRCPGLFGGSNKKSEEHLREVTDLQPEQQRHRTSSSPKPCSTWDASRCARRAAEGDRRPRRSRLGARRSRVQGKRGGCFRPSDNGNCAPHDDRDDDGHDGRTCGDGPSRSSCHRPSWSS